MAKQKNDEELLEALEGVSSGFSPAEQFRMELTSRHFKRLTEVIDTAGRSADRLAKVGLLVAIVSWYWPFVGACGTVFIEGNN
jgi:hypothetical protein